MKIFKKFKSTPLFIRIQTSFRILFRSDRHWFLVSLTKENLVLHLIESNQEITYDVTTHKLARYNVQTIIKELSSDITDIDMMLSKAAYEGEVELYKSKNKK
jgi:hypothetical protein